jgi:hypothetical protein
LERIFRARIQKEGFSLKSAIGQRKRLLHVLRLQNYRTVFPDFWKPIQIATLKGLQGWSRFFKLKMADQF